MGFQTHEVKQTNIKLCLETSILLCQKYMGLVTQTEKAMAPHSSTLAWKIPWMEPGRLQSIGSLRVRHDWATSLSLFTFMHWRRKWQPTPVFLPGESQGRGWAAVYGVTQSPTWLKRLSSSSSYSKYQKGYKKTKHHHQSTESTEHL